MIVDFFTYRLCKVATLYISEAQFGVAVMSYGYLLVQRILAILTVSIYYTLNQLIFNYVYGNVVSIMIYDNSL